MTSVEKLCDMLNKKGFYVEKEKFSRTYAGQYQRSQGAFVWVINSYPSIGSSYTVKELLRGFDAVKSGHGYELIPIKSKV